jgi:hypothetical protein
LGIFYRGSVGKTYGSVGNFDGSVGNGSVGHGSVGNNSIHLGIVCSAESRGVFEKQMAKAGMVKDCGEWKDSIGSYLGLKESFS